MNKMDKFFKILDRSKNLPPNFAFRGNDIKKILLSPECKIQGITFDLYGYEVCVDYSFLDVQGTLYL